MTDTLTTLVDVQEKQLAWSEVGTKEGVDYKFAQYFVSDDGGRSEYGYKGSTRDCFCRSLAITSDLTYQEAYDMTNEYAKSERTTKRKRGKSSARTGVHTETAHKILDALGFEWTPTMKIGSGCKVHCRADELPSGKLILNLTRHFTAMIDGVIHDTHDPSRQGTRCVYGYWKKV